MKLTSFRVRKFRNVVDSGPIEVDPKVTCLVGKNEAGKSAMIEALYLFNPAYGEDFDVADQYPRWLVVRDRRDGDLDEETPIEAQLKLEDDDIAAVELIFGSKALDDDCLTVTRKYGGGTIWSLSVNEPGAIEHLKSHMPAPVATSLKDIRTLSALSQALGDASATQDGMSPSEKEVADAIEVLDSRGLDSASIWQGVVNILKGRLPKFFKFTNYSTLPGRIDFRELSRVDEEGPGRSALQTARALLQLAGTDIDQLGSEDYELRKGELEAVQIDLTNQVFDYWKQNPDLEVLIDVDKETVASGGNRSAVTRFLDIRLRDKRTGYSNNFVQRSSGFQWFFSFLAAFTEFEEKASPIVLLDEPALALHGKAQADFMRFINQRLARTGPVIYTTHSPFMVEAGRLDRVRIVEDQGPPTGATSTKDALVSDPDSLFPLQAALGYDIAQNLFVGPHNLVVEGTSDFLYLTLMSEGCVKSGREGLDPRWRILPAGGASNIPTFVSLVGPSLEITVFADSDTTGMQRVTNMIKRGLLASHRLVLASVASQSPKADVEDLFSEGDYLKLYNKTFGTSVRVSDLPDGDRIVKRIEAHSGDFVHGEVAETLLRQHQDFSLTDKSLDQFEKVYRAINQTMVD